MSRNRIYAAISVIPLLGGLCSTGCGEKPPIEQFASTFVTDVVKPSVEKGLAQGIRSSQMQAGAQAINPKYIVDFEGYWVTGIKGRASIGAEGVSGQIQVSSTGDQDTKNSPANPATSQPSGSVPVKAPPSN